MHKLAFLTVGVLHEPVGHPRVQGFVDRLPAVYAAADASAGFQARSIRDVVTWKHSWGEVVPPACYPKLDISERYAMTLSLWNDIESVAAFSYNGAHAEALLRRKDWFQSLGLPGYVAWWVPEDHHVGWKVQSGWIICALSDPRRSRSTLPSRSVRLVTRIALIAWRWKPRHDKMWLRRNKPVEVHGTYLSGDCKGSI